MNNLTPTISTQICCPICLNSIETPQDLCVTSCHHTFHTQCFVQRRGVCPVCYIGEPPPVTSHPWTALEISNVLTQITELTALVENNQRKRDAICHEIESIISADLPKISTDLPKKTTYCCIS